MNHLFQKFRHDIVAIAWLGGGLFLGLALWSYSPTDPSLNSIGTQLKAQNYCGYFGSFLADVLYQAVGLSAWVFFVASLRMAWRSFRGKDVALRNARLIWGLMLLVTVSSLLSLYFGQVRLFGGEIRVGGLMGMGITSALVGVFNYAGVTVILWSLAVVLVVFYTEKSLVEVARFPLAFVPRLKFLSQWMSYRPKWPRWPRRLEPMPAVATSPPPVTSPEPEPLQPPRKSLFALKSNDAEKKFELNLRDKLKPWKRQTNSKARKKVVRKTENWELPQLYLLKDPPTKHRKIDDKEIHHKADLLLDKLEQFSVKGQIIGIKPGPAVTMFEFKPAADVKISKITELADDLSLALSSESVRIIAPIPGRDVVGIETSNSIRDTVYLKDIVSYDPFWDEHTKIPVTLGRYVDGEPAVVDLRRMPHLLVAGTTGSGKSVFVVSMLTAMLFRHSPETLRLILIDPKQVDLSVFSKVPHLLMPPIREPKKAVTALKWAIREMEKRYRSMSKFGANGIDRFNQTVSQLTEDQRKEHEQINLEFEENSQVQEQYYFSKQPLIVVVVEEFGDLMAVDKNNVEQSVVRLAQMARACGIHLVLAMQSPRRDVVTGLIKTNIPGRISFKVASKTDSRIILDESGAERLLARGDMLFLAPGVSKPQRVHGPWAGEEEIEAVTANWSDQGEAEYDPMAMAALEGSGGGYDLDGDVGFDDEDGDGEYDERYDEILHYVSSLKEVSASLLQRKFRLGYPRAARVIEVFEQEGVVGPANGSKPRQVLISQR